MISTILKKLGIGQEELLLYSFGLLTIGCILLSIKYQISIISLIPFGVLVGYVCLVDFEKVYFLLLGLLPLSMELYLPNGLATDMPSEPLMIMLMGVYFLYFLQNFNNFKKDFFLHPITLLLGLHYTWIIVSTLTSSNPLFSIKYSLAKLWYIVTFFFMTGLILRNLKKLKAFIWIITIPLIFTIIYALINHAQFGFSFKTSSNVVYPFYRNHVNYAAIIAFFLPFIWILRSMEPKLFSKKSIFLWTSMIIAVTGLLFSYTRAAYLALFVTIGTYWIIRLKLMRVALVATIVLGFLITTYFVQDNHYMSYAPEFEKTISHKNFDNLVAATTTGEDASLMERFYRWTAGLYMVQEKPYFGFGPGNFYTFYKGYAVTSFTTYVSGNPEKSGIHNYFLMIGVEQGFPGLFLFLLLFFYFFYKAEKVYHNTKNTRPELAKIVMGAILCQSAIGFLLIINDLIETDKVGSFFFICLAIVVNVDLIEKNSRKKQVPNPSN